VVISVRGSAFVGSFAEWIESGERSSARIDIRIQIFIDPPPSYDTPDQCDKVDATDRFRTLRCRSAQHAHKGRSHAHNPTIASARVVGGATKSGPRDDSGAARLAANPTAKWPRNISAS